MNETYQDLENYPKRTSSTSQESTKYPTTFEELFKGTDIKPTTDKEGNIHYNFKATKKTPEEYFTPSIEDIRVGYECEMQVEVGKERIIEWRREVVGRGTYILSMFDAGKIRVPYLTKEQIEKEGWVPVNEAFWEHKKNHMRLLYDPSERLLEITNLDFSRETTRRMGYPDDSNFKGKCKDINTFRYILKLLGI